MSAARSVAAAILCSLTIVSLPPQRADALTSDEYFIEAVYRDFLLRYPTSSESAWWSSYLTANSNTSFVQSVLGDSEFELLWIIGVRYRYLGSVQAEDPQFDTDLSNLASSGDFVDAEVALLASSAYFSLKGGTNTTYVEAIYNDVLLRASDLTGRSYWVGRLNAGTATRAQLAETFIRTTEAANRRVGGPSGATSCATTSLEDVASISAGAYCLVLDRLALSSDITYWSGQLSSTAQLPSLWASLAGSAEYYNNSQP